MTATAVPEPLRAALLGFAAGRAALAQVLRVRPLPSGVRNRVFRVTGRDLDWAVRLGAAGAGSLGADRDSEVRAWEAAAAAGLAPPLVHFDGDGDVLVSGFVAAPTWTRRRARSMDGIRAIGRRLARLHSLPTPAGVRAFSAREAMRVLLAALPPAPRRLARERLERHAAAALADFVGEGAALCHLDLHHRNVIGRSAVLFIDWEYAGVGDPAIDLAAYACYHDFDAARRDALVVAHGAAVPAARLDAACRLFDGLQACWYEAADAWGALPPARRDELLARVLP